MSDGGKGQRLSRMAAFALMGAFALAAQTALFREYLVVYKGNELGTGIFFSSWLLWVGAGAMLSRLALRGGTAGRWFPVLLGAYPAAFLLQLILIRSLRDLGGVAPTDLFPFATLFLMTFVTNAPVSLITGALFPVGSTVARETEREVSGAVSRVYVLECLGAFSGGVAITCALLLGVGALTVVAVISALLGVVGIAMSPRHGGRASAALGLVILLSSLLMLVPAVGGALRGALDRGRIESLYPGGELLASTESPNHRLETVRLGTQTLALSDGRVLAVEPADDARLSDAVLLAAQPGRLARVAILGDGDTALLTELLRYPVEEIIMVTPDARGLSFLIEEMPDSYRAAFDDPRVQVVHGDALKFLREGTAPLDLVVVDAGDPDTALATRFFTAEFYEAAADRLAADGVLATAITSAENYFGTEIARYGASVLATLETVFPEIRIAPGEQAWFLAGNANAPVSVDGSVLEARLRALDVRNRRYEPERIHSRLEPDRVAFIREVYGGLPVEERRDLVVTEDRPQVYLMNLLVLGKREGSGLSRLVHAVRRAGVLVFLLPLAILLLVRTRYTLGQPDRGRSLRFSGGYLLAVTGAAAIGITITLLLGYQQRFGHLFLSAGMANALFMLGLFGGGVVGIRLSRLPFSPGRLAGTVALAAAVFAMTLPWISKVVNGEAAFLGLFLVAGGLCGAPFSLAAHLLGRAGAETGDAGAALTAADHFGGAVGAATAGLLLVPLFGAAATCRLLGVLLASAPALFILEGLAGQERFARRLRTARPSFPYVRTGFVLFALVAAVVAVSGPVRREMDRPLIHLDPDRVRAVVPEASRFEMQESPFPHHIAYRQSEAVNYTLATMAIPVAVPGYAGPINLLLSMDRDGTIRKVELLESEETPAYIRDLPGFLSRFEGLKADADFRLVEKGEADAPHDIVNVTGASVSCRASLETVNRAKNHMLTDLLGMKTPSGTHESAGVSVGLREGLVMCFLLAAVAIFLRGGSTVRTVFLVLVLGVLGFWLNEQVSAGRVTDLLRLELPPPGNLSHFLLVAGALLLAVTFGQVYCGLLCPFGAAQELLSKLGLVRPVSPGVDRRARFIKHVVLAVTAVGVLLFGLDGLLDYDPLGVAFSLNAAPLMWVLIGLVLVTSLFRFRPWCRYFCPVGAFFSLGNRIAILAGLARKKEYARCDLGVRGERDLDCIQCNRCLTASSERHGRRKKIDGWLVAGIAAALLLMAILVTGAGGAADTTTLPAGYHAGEGLPGEPRDVDVDLLRRRILRGDLTDHEALYYHRDGNK